MNILVTGAAGFIGFYLSKRLLEQGETVVGFDNINDYYDTRLKQARLDILSGFDKFTFVKGDLADKKAVDEIFAEHKPEIAVNLAAQAGVRYSITNPEAYISSNIAVSYTHLLAAVIRLLNENVGHIYIAGKEEPSICDIPVEMREKFSVKTSFFRIDLNAEYYEIFDTIRDIDTLIILSLIHILNFDAYLHNNYIELLAGGGIIGAAVYYSMYVYLLTKTWKLRLYKNDEYGICLIVMLLLLIVDWGSVSCYSKSTYFYFMLFNLQVKNLMSIKRRSQ